MTCAVRTFNRTKDPKVLRGEAYMCRFSLHCVLVSVEGALTAKDSSTRVARVSLGRCSVLASVMSAEPIHCCELATANNTLILASHAADCGQLGQDQVGKLGVGDGGEVKGWRRRKRLIKTETGEYDCISKHEGEGEGESCQ